MEKTIITTDSDAVITVVLARPTGELPEALAPDAVPAIDEDMFFSFRVGRQEYNQRVSANQTTRRKGQPEVDRVTLKYVRERGKNRLVRPDDAPASWLTGDFVCIKFYIPRDTFSSVGDLEVAQASYSPDSNFQGNRRKEWTMYAESGVRYAFK